MTYWRIRLNHQSHYDYVHLKIDKPLRAASIPAEAVRTKMLIDVFLCRVDQVRKVSREEYLEHMTP